MSVDTGAGTPLTAEEKIAGLDAWAASDAPDEEWAGVRKDTWRLARSRPTDPAGLDALRDIVDRCRQHIAGLGADLLTIKAREATSAQRDAAADRAYAHLKGIDTILTDAIRDARLTSSPDTEGGPSR